MASGACQRPGAKKQGVDTPRSPGKCFPLVARGTAITIPRTICIATKPRARPAGILAWSIRRGGYNIRVGGWPLLCGVVRIRPARAFTASGPAAFVHLLPMAVAGSWQGRQGARRARGGRFSRLAHLLL